MPASIAIHLTIEECVDQVDGTADVVVAKEQQMTHSSLVTYNNQAIRRRGRIRGGWIRRMGLATCVECCMQKKRKKIDQCLN